MRKVNFAQHPVSSGALSRLSYNKGRVQELPLLYPVADLSR